MTAVRSVLVPVQNYLWGMNLKNKQQQQNRDLGSISDVSIRYQQVCNILGCVFQIKHKYAPVIIITILQRNSFLCKVRRTSKHNSSDTHKAQKLNETAYTTYLHQQQGTVFALLSSKYHQNTDHHHSLQMPSKHK